MAEEGFLPDFMIRIGIRKLSKVRLDFAENLAIVRAWDSPRNREPILKEK